MNFHIIRNMDEIKDVSSLDGLLEKYFLQLEEDFAITRVGLVEKSLRVPAIKHRWTGLLMRHIRLGRKLETMEGVAKEKALREISMSDEGMKMSQSLLLREAANHPDVKKIGEHRKTNADIVLFLEKSEKTLASLTWDVKNCADILKMETT